MHIVHLLAALHTGGSELVVLELTEAARKNGHRLTVVSAAGDLCPRLHASGAEHLHWSVGEKSLATLGLIKRLANWLKDNPADIVHAHSRLPAWIVLKAIAKLPEDLRPHLITSVHGQYSVSKYSAVMTRGERVIAVSNSIAKYIRSNYPSAESSKIVVIPPGTDPQQFAWQLQPSADWQAAFTQQFPAIAQRQLLTLPGRITRLKGHKCFVRLIAGLVGSGRDVHGLIVGPMGAAKQHYLDEIAELAIDLGVADRFDYAGNRQDMAELMARSDLVLNLSIKAEAFGRTVLEALSVGTPVVAWNRGGVSELLTELFPQGRVEPGNEAALLEVCSKQLCTVDKVKSRHAYTLAAMNESTLALYAEVCSA